MLPNDNATSTMMNNTLPPPNNFLSIFVYNANGKLIQGEEHHEPPTTPNNINTLFDENLMMMVPRLEPNLQLSTTPWSVSPYQPLMPIPNFSNAFIVDYLPTPASTTPSSIKAIRRKNRKISVVDSHTPTSKIMQELESSLLTNNNLRRIPPTGPLVDISNTHFPQKQYSDNIGTPTKKPRIRQLTTPPRGANSKQKKESIRSEYIDDETNNYSFIDSDISKTTVPPIISLKTKDAKDSEFKQAMATNLGLSTDDFECKPFETAALPSVIDKNYLVVDKEGHTQLALLPNHIPTSLCKIIEAKCRKISSLRRSLKIKKTSFYVNWWTKSQPMGYMCKDNESVIGELANEVSELLSDHCRNLLRMCNEKVYSKISELKEDKLFAPCICFNILEPGLESRITKYHHDQMDYGVSVLFYFGEYSGGNLNVIDTGVKSTIVTQPGDAVVLRGNYYKHCVEDIEPGENKARYSIVFFAHTTHFNKKKYALSPAAAKKAFLVDNPNFVSIKKRKQAQASSSSSNTVSSEGLSSGKKAKPSSSTAKPSTTESTTNTTSTVVDSNVEYIQTHDHLGNGHKSGFKNYQYYVKFKNVAIKDWTSYENLPKEEVSAYWKKFKKASLRK